MTDPYSGSAEEGRYADWKAQIRSELEAFEGHGPPDAEELWHIAGHHAEAVSSWTGDMPVSESEIKTGKGDLLKALVALEMAEELLDGGDS